MTSVSLYWCSYSVCWGSGYALESSSGSLTAFYRPLYSLSLILASCYIWFSFFFASNSAHLIYICFLISLILCCMSRRYSEPVCSAKTSNYSSSVFFSNIFYRIFSVFSKTCSLTLTFICFIIDSLISSAKVGVYNYSFSPGYNVSVVTGWIKFSAWD